MNSEMRGSRPGSGNASEGQIVHVAARDRLDAALEFIEVGWGEPVDPLV